MGLRRGRLRARRRRMVGGRLQWCLGLDVIYGEGWVWLHTIPPVAPPAVQACLLLVPPSPWTTLTGAEAAGALDHFEADRRAADRLQRRLLHDDMKVGRTRKGGVGA